VFFCPLNAARVLGGIVGAALEDGRFWVIYEEGKQYALLGPIFLVIGKPSQAMGSPYDKKMS
jgi:hypothetical protein